MTTHNLTTDCPLAGWTNTKTVVTGLWSGWRYSLTITATTALGSRTVQLSQTVTMPESRQ